jgi:ADP-ribosylglycohydrolase
VVEAQPPATAAAYVQDVLRAGRASERTHPAHTFGQYSDDTQLARELLLSVRDARGWRAEAFAERIAELFRAGGDVGAGRGTRAAADRLIAGRNWKDAGTPAPYAGNGSAMRAVPFGLLFAGDSETLRRAVREQSLVTHRDPRCAAGAIAVAGAAALTMGSARVDAGGVLRELARWIEEDDASVAEAVLEIEAWLPLSAVDAAERLRDAGLDPGHISPWRGISGFVTPSVAWTLYAFLRSPDDYWETVCTAIAVGGDTDTMAAMAGALVGARVGPAGLPADLVGRLHDRGEWRAEALAELAEACTAFAR